MIFIFIISNEHTEPNLQFSSLISGLVALEGSISIQNCINNLSLVFLYKHIKTLSFRFLIRLIEYFAFYHVSMSEMLYVTIKLMFTVPGG